jgi:hypothetical protein
MDKYRKNLPAFKEKNNNYTLIRFVRFYLHISLLRNPFL